MSNISACAAILASFALAFVATDLASAERNLRKGKIPGNAIDNNQINLDLVPDFIIAYNRDGEVAGYIPKDDLFSEEGIPRLDRRIVVLDSETLSRPVGAMVPGRGFVGVGTKEAAVPLFDGQEE